MENFICSLARKSGPNVINIMPNLQQHSNTAQFSTSKIVVVLIEIYVIK
jgi:hypothetical protein